MFNSWRPGPGPQCCEATYLIMPDTVFHITHDTRYAFARPIARLEVTARLRPPATPWQEPRNIRVSATPAPARHETDGAVDHMVFDQPLQAVTLRGQSTLTLRASGTAALFDDPETTVGAADPAIDDPLIQAWARETLGSGTPTPDRIAAFMARLQRDFVFDPNATDPDGDIRTFFLACRGVCEDFTRLAVSCLRSRGVPARHVVGYLLPAGSDGTSFGRRAHAWPAVLDPARGWIGFDPTTGIAVPSAHAVLTWGDGHRDTAPIRGRIEDGSASVGQNVTVDVSVMRETG